MSTFSPTAEIPADANPIVQMVHAGVIAEREKQKARNYLGASRWGEKCERRLGYEYNKFPVPDDKRIQGKTYAVFDMGHDGEKRVAEYLRLGGFTLLTERPDGSQFGFKAAPHPETGDSRLAGHIDGVFTDGPTEYNGVSLGLTYPLMWENKALGKKSWGDVVKKGVRKSKPVYYTQLQTYCAYMDVPNGGLFTALNRDTGELYVEFVPFDPITAQEASDKALRVISASDPRELPRHTNDQSNFECSWCPFFDLCWKTPTITANINTIPSWIKT